MPSEPDQPFILYRQAEGDWLQFDNCIEERHAIAVTASAHPLEDGESVTDHAQRQNDRHTIRAVITESPWRVTGAESSGPDRIRAALAFIDKCVGTVLTLGLTRTNTVNDALLLGAEYPINNRRQIVVDLTFQVCRFAEATSVKIPALKPVVVVAVGAADEVDAGQQACTAVSTDTDSDARAPADPFIAQDQSDAYAFAHAADPVRFP